MVTPATFRLAFPAFADSAIYSDYAIILWITRAAMLLDVSRWKNQFDYGTMLYVAHKLVLAQRDARMALRGGLPGAWSGIVTSKSIDKVSASYDIGKITFENAGQYNATSYGVELWQLILQFGAGPIQVF